MCTLLRSLNPTSKFNRLLDNRLSVLVRHLHVILIICSLTPIILIILLCLITIDHLFLMHWWCWIGHEIEIICIIVINSFICPASAVVICLLRRHHIR